MSQLRPRFKNVFATLSLTAAVAFASNNTIAQQPEHAHHTDQSAAYGQDIAATNAAAQRKAAIDSTESFINAHKQWAQARGASNKAVALQSLIAKAEARYEMMAELIRTNPAEALRVAIPEEKQVGMPAEVLEMLEEKVELEGEYEARYEDYADGTHKFRQFLKTPFGERFELHMNGERPELGSGAQVRAYGLLLANGEESSTDGELALEAGEESLQNLAYAGSTETSALNETTVINGTFGEQRTLVMLVNFQDKQEQPYTRAFAQDMMFGEVNDFVKENAYSQTWISGDVTNWRTLPIDGANCDSLAIGDYADAAAQASGYDLSSYTRLVYVFPKVGCGWSGSAQYGGTRTQTRTWINGYYDLHTLTHELGHNFGLSHSSSLACNDGTIIGTGIETSVWGDPWPNCAKVEYGDEIDVMGNSPSAHYNAGQKERLGWLNYGGSPAIQTVTQSGSYEIGVLADQSSSLPKGLKILKYRDADTGKEIWYHLEFRQPVGFDSTLGNSYWGGNAVYPDNVLNGVLIHARDTTNRSFLLDMTPETFEYFHRDPALTVGNTFHSPDGDVSFTTEWTDSGKAIVNVSFDGAPAPTCSRAKPSLSLTPGQSDWVTAGTTVNYSVTVTNNDSSACSNSSFNLSGTVPSGWGKTFTNSSLSLSPGQSATTTLTVTSAASATDGFYTIDVTASNGSYSANDSVTYVVDTPVVSNSAPVANSDSAVTDAGVAVSIPVLNNDSDPEGDSLTVTSVSGVNGSAGINSNGSIIYTPAIGFSGTEVFSYSISDGNGGSASASVTVTVNAAPVDSNSAPVAVNDSGTMPSVAAITIAALANDSDPEGDTLTVQAVTQGAKGSVRINSDGTLTYTPGRRFKNADSFSYTISDGAKTATATVSVQLQKSTGGSNGKGNGKKN